LSPSQHFLFARLAYTSYQRASREGASWETLPPETQDRWQAVQETVAARLSLSVNTWRDGHPVYEAYHVHTPMIAWESLDTEEQRVWNTVAFMVQRAMQPELPTWEAATEWRRVRVIIEQVLGWECFLSWEDYLRT